MATGQSTVAYRDIPEFPGYRAGDDGTIWSRIRRGGGPGRAGELCEEWHQIMGWITGQGYRAVSVRDGSGQRHHRFVHVLVLTAFVGPRPAGADGCHADDDGLNNRLANLRWDTRKGNMRDAVRNGRVPTGEQNHFAKLTVTEVQEIRRQTDAGVPQRVVAARFRVCQQTISDVRRRTWKQVDG